MSTDNMAGEAPVVPAQYSRLPLSVPKCGSPPASEKQLSKDVTSPSNLSLKQSLLEYTEVPVSYIDMKIVVKNVNIP